MGGGFTDGFLHPVTGLDHVVAMVAVGLWGAQLGAPAIWLLPITFPLVMAVGGLLGVIGVPFPGVDAGVALSGVVLGALVAMACAHAAVDRRHRRRRIRPSSRTCAWHGHAPEWRAGRVRRRFRGGNGAAPSFRHLTGLLTRWPSGAMVVRAGGVAIALVAGYSLVALLGGAR